MRDASASEATSARTKAACPPSDPISWTAPKPASSSTSATTTVSPSRARRAATAWPIPAPAPVTRATFFRTSIALLPVRRCGLPRDDAALSLTRLGDGGRPPCRARERRDRVAQRDYSAEYLEREILRSSPKGQLRQRSIRGSLRRLEDHPSPRR